MISRNPPPDAVPDRDYFTVMAHFYRGELSRALMWRQRLDATTNWAIISATGVVTFALGNPSISHIVFMLANIIVFLLLMIEGRRYRYYDAYRARVRILEAHLLVPTILKDTTLLQGDWRSVLAEDMLIPSFKMTMTRAIGRRLRQNYGWVFLIILVSLGLKIVIDHPDATTVGVFLRELHHGQPLTPIVYWFLFAGFYSLLIYLFVKGRPRAGASGEFSRHTPRPDAWSL